MDDLSGLNWSSTNPNKEANKPSPMNPMNPPSFYSTLRPTPSPQPSGRTTPLSTQGSGFAALKPQTGKPAADSFSGLVSFGGAKSNANLSLRERQEQLEAQRRQKEEEDRRKLQSQYGGGQFWDNIGQSSTPASRTISPAIPSPLVGSGIGSQIGQEKNDDDDLFAAFNRDTKVDNASHFPPPEQQLSRKSTPANTAQLDLTSASAWNKPTALSGGELGDDDDPFGLSQMKKQPQQQLLVNDDEDDDFLGDLGKPVDEVRRKTQATQPKPKPEPEPGRPIEAMDSDSEPEMPPRGASSDPFDKAVAELVDMGFTAENARRGLTESGAGLSIQAAVGWLLDDAHRQARNNQSPAEPAPGRTRRDDNRSRNHGNPAWMSGDHTGDPPSRRDNRSPVSGDDFSKRAAAVGSSFFKTANSLWKSGQKQVQKAVADFQQEGGDPSQPKWMRSAHLDQSYAGKRESQNTTDEALMLESGARPERHPSRPTRSLRSESRDQSPALPTRPRTHSPGVPKWQQEAPPSSRDPRVRLNKQDIEEQSAQAYVSPARRKKAAPQLAPPSESEPTLLFDQPSDQPSQSQPRRAAQSSTPSTKPPTRAPSKPITPRLVPPTRNVPAIPSSTLEASTRHRLEGTAHFKRGDYDAAHTSYTNSLAGIPQSHPICIVLLTNRALTALKTGSPKQAVGDADAAIGIIGPSHGEGEKVALPDGETREMKDLYGKALSRKAEALEQMEKWTDAGNVWQQCVEAGVGGANAIAGRQRCQKALAPKPKPAPKPAQVVKPRPKPSVVSDLNSQKGSEAVQRLRQANKAAEAADDEKFALSEKVDAKIASWRDGKRDNLRALLGSLDQVLWENSGWKKVGLHELVVANKVKIHYMKAIAKCHPDKLPQDASTEVRLIAATVFATLNESWDKFKTENGL